MIKFYSNFEQNEEIGYKYDKEEIELAENEVIQSLKEIKYNVSQFEKMIEIERCVINLLGNAVKFTPEGGEIRVYIKEVKGFNVLKLKQ